MFSFQPFSETTGGKINKYNRNVTTWMVLVMLFDSRFIMKFNMANCAISLA